MHTHWPLLYKKDQHLFLQELKASAASSPARTVDDYCSRFLLPYSGAANTPTPAASTKPSSGPLLPNECCAIRQRSLFCSNSGVE
uniref:Uncharacterized protein n=1 Tax=Romanomermis culicivorax TaxID=13658 RepID=A0A915KAU1_ROMCU